MNILSNGQVNIGSQIPNKMFQVGDGARLKISNGINDHSLIGTKNVYDTTEKYKNRYKCQWQCKNFTK